MTRVTGTALQVVPVLVQGSTMEFKDHAVIYVSAGQGGDGCIAFRREKYVPKGGPAGGDGGRGGSVLIESGLNENTLLSHLRNPHVKAESGEPGMGKGMHGRTGKDAIVRVPVGTMVYDLKTGALLRDLKHPGDSVCVSRGGNGGHGNMHFKCSTNQAPRYAVPGQDGEKRDVRLELKLIADVGLVGLPNAGKSTLVRRVSAARPEVANYPFTTLIPHPGVVELAGMRRFVMVDIPGLIEGAADGRGLGHRFLRHVERTRVIVHMVDLASPGDPAEDYRVITRELEKYSTALAEKPRITVFNKIDSVPDAEETVRALAEEIGVSGAYGISGISGTGIDRLLEDSWRLMNPVED